MSINYQDFLDRAQNSSQSAASEMDHRAAAREYYYGSYHRALALLTHPVQNYLGNDDGPKTCHAALVHYLSVDAHKYEKTLNKNKLKQLGLFINQLKIKRHKADYKLHEDFTIEDVAEVNKYIEKLNKAFEHLEAPCPA